MFDIAVIGADRFAAALLAAVTDPDLRAAPLIGAVSQCVDSTDALTRKPTIILG